MSTALRRTAAYAGLLVATLAVWATLSAAGAVKAVVLPPPRAVLRALSDLFATPSVLAEPVLVTLRETGAAFALAAVLGIAVGLVIGPSRLLMRAYEPLLASASALPLVVLYPVLAATLGLGTSSKIVLGVLYGFFPVAIATSRAASRVEPTLLSAAQAMGAGRARVLRSVVLPAVAPQVFGGLRVALGLTLVTVIAGEFIAGADGLGYQLAESSQSLNTPALFGWVVITVLLTILVNAVFTLATTGVQKGLAR